MKLQLMTCKDGTMEEDHRKLRLPGAELRGSGSQTGAMTCLLAQSAAAGQGSCAPQPGQGVLSEKRSKVQHSVWHCR